MSEENLFIIDDQPADEEVDSELNEAPIPFLSSSKFILGLKDGDDDSEKNKESEDEEDYFGLPPPSIRIADALAQCPFQATYFKSKSDEDKVKSEKFKDKLLCSLDDYLSELRIKTKHQFVTDGIETKRDISTLGMSDNQLRKLNRVSIFNNFKFINSSYDEKLQTDVILLSDESILDSMSVSICYSLKSYFNSF